MAALKTLEDLFIHGLKDIYNAEKQLVKALPKLAKAASADRMSIWRRLRRETVNRESSVKRLDITRGEHLSDVAIELLAASDLFEPAEQVFGTDSGSRATC